MEVRETRLGNGLRVATARIPQIESVSVGIWVGAGSRFERKAQAGISHFLEHMLFKGTKKRSLKDISQDIEGRGGQLNGFTQTDHTCYYARVAYNNAWDALDVLADMYLNPRLDEKDVRRETGVIVEEIMMYRDQPQHVVNDMLEAAMWLEHPVGRPIVGRPETVSALGRRDFVEYRDRMYGPDNTLLTLVGKVDHDECVRHATRYFGRLRKRGVPSCVRVTPKVGQSHLAVQAKDIEQTHMVLGTRLFGRNDKRRFPLKIMNIALGENMSSRLFQSVREKHGLAYAIHSYASLIEDTGALLVSAGLDRNRYMKAVELTVRELAKLKTVKIGHAELKRAKDCAVGQIRLGLESTWGQMTWLAETMMFYGRFIEPGEIIDSLNAVTADEIRRLAAAIFNPRNMTIAMMAPGLSEKDGKAVWSHVARL